MLKLTDVIIPAKYFYKVSNQRLIQITEDGSHTIIIPSKKIIYHSTHGALQESRHIFINSGLKYFLNKYADANETIHVFEMGLGTGLNALLTWQEAALLKQKIFYHAVELYPLTKPEADSLNYDNFMENNNVRLSAIHHSAWNELISLNEYFSFIKTNADIQNFNTAQKFNLIYFDAFDPNAQPELWTEIIFKKMFDLLLNNGILVTYCSKGAVQRAMKTAGFIVQKLKGPPGKREIIRAIKTTH
ncbi:tRNA (5-methylaminomethyl-2-thiouridine)(34)-methyltransferase MnmD [Parafilimonas terrae]|uniref:tRNA U34 5-methylaminomethyl-2-thiouridine-forming methyltransferase MnmC n=1 Tax=Parafilimonas terrae TaxID=1465490 RepID=A0A1I5UX38_9BACT|nr:tRNA (5-methylaminomethyl-2-thiouridine)(34)-methyltransferase MnmD [Parafilimonas terrae]SFP99607.1 tRNA U34 5-methylaminomethyl-2-thiouridine-forming methyltransferase MnmC [Parafilimonas terrae]